MLVPVHSAHSLIACWRVAAQTDVISISRDRDGKLCDTSNFTVQLLLPQLVLHYNHIVALWILSVTNQVSWY